jgi:hypothetical protein
VKSDLVRRLVVIGTAGRGDDADRMSLALYDRMYQALVDLVERWKPDTLVSGGAAWADHLAVRGYLEGLVPNLLLFLPAEFRLELGKPAFLPNPKVQFNPGRTLNNYHEAFRQRTGIDSLAELAEALRRGAIVEVHPGFHRRNSEVADHGDGLASFTFGTHSSYDLDPKNPAFNNAKKAGLKDGGTAHTFGECWKAEFKSHYNLFDFMREFTEDETFRSAPGI